MSSQLISATDKAFNGEQLVEQTPYSILFGPDKFDAMSSYG
jgi:hypothetical protein